MKKLFLSLLLVILMTSTGCGTNTTEAPKSNQPQSAMKQEKVTVAVKEEKIQSETLEAELKIPQISDMKNKEAQAELNSKFDAIYTLKDSLQKEAEKALIDSKTAGYPFRPYQLFSDYKVSYNAKGYLSMTTLVYTYTGGAHGGSATTSYNVDINSGEAISLKSMFQEGVNYKDLINKEIAAQIAQQPENYFEGEYGFKTIADEQNFYLKEGMLVVYFSEYEIAPYATGTPEFNIPISLLKESLKPEYRTI